MIEHHYFAVGRVQTTAAVMTSYFLFIDIRYRCPLRISGENLGELKVRKCVVQNVHLFNFRTV